MVLTESQSHVHGNAISESPQQQLPQGEGSTKDPSNPPLVGQSSLLSLTLNEIQLKRSKSLGSMNMDEFLADLWSVDENQISPLENQNELAIASTSSTNTIPNQHSSVSGQNHFSTPTSICKKMVDEVLLEITKDEPTQNHQCQIAGAQHPNLGELTLEDFLVKAGVIQESWCSTSTQQRIASTPIHNPNTCFGTNFGMASHVIDSPGFPPYQQNVVTGNGLPPYQMFPTSNCVKSEQDSALMELSAQQQNRKRVMDGPSQVVIERRQRRMIKNRESAARSRARKQAYTVELELELNQLKEENVKLKQTVEDIEQKRKEEVMNRKPSKISQRQAEKLRSMRRTISLP